MRFAKSETSRFLPVYSAAWC